MSRPRTIQLISLILAGGALAGAAALQGPINTARRRMDILDRQDQVAGETFPELRLLQAMPGGLRALAIDYLWIRSQEHKQHGEFYDAQHLADLICNLQPRFPGVWVFHSWNLAYNISVTANSPAQRWYWIRQGIDLLRDRGLKYNPESIELYNELATIYFGKVADITDEDHPYYKRALAEEYNRVLGGPPVDEGKQAVLAWLAPMEAAPDSKQKLLADPAVAKLVGELAKVKVKLNLGLLDDYNTWSNDELVQIIHQPAAPMDTPTDWTLAKLMTDPALNRPLSERFKPLGSHPDLQAVWASLSPLEKVVAFVRRNVLLNTYKLHPSWMAEMTRRYGPVDWRSPYAHTLYWSTYGLYHVRRAALGTMDATNTMRLSFIGLKGLVDYGRITLVYDPRDPDLPLRFASPEWRFIAACHQAYLNESKMLPGQPGNKEYKYFKAGHMDFLKNAIDWLWLAGQKKSAQYYLDYLRETYKPTDPMYALPLDQFFFATLNQFGMPHRRQMDTLISTLLARSYAALLRGDAAQHNSFLYQATNLWQEYNKQYPKRSQLQSLPTIQSITVAQVIKDARILGLRKLSTVQASMLYKQLPLPTQEHSFPIFEQAMRMRCQAEKLDFNTLFPAPPGVTPAGKPTPKGQAQAQQTQ